MNTEINISLPCEINEILTRIMEHGGEAYIVGGAIRDALLGRPINDWDIATSLKPDDIERLFSHTRTISVGKKYGTVIVIMNGKPIQVTTYRGEGEYLDFRRPNRVVFLSDIADDLARRDFTVNAMAYNPYLTPAFIDPFGGVVDITKRTIRTVGSPGERFSEDPLRILRGIRFSAELSFELDSKAMEAARTYGRLLSQISFERIRDELNRILLVSDPFYPLMMLHQLGLFKIILPDLWQYYGHSTALSCSFRDGFHLAIKAVSLCRSDIILRLAALYCLNNINKLIWADTSGPINIQAAGCFAKAAELSLKRLRYDGATTCRVLSLVTSSPLPLNLKEAEAAYHLRKIIGKIGQADTYRLLELEQAYLSAAGQQQGVKCIRRYTNIVNEIISRGDPVTMSQMAINGNDVLGIGIGTKDKRIIGKALNQAYEWVLMDPECNDKQQLLSRLKAVFRQMRT